MPSIFILAEQELLANRIALNLQMCDIIITYLGLLEQAMFFNGEERFFIQSPFLR
ncbi:MAG: hypothetical protein UV38_C0002G0156 [candidate division TM6 bacterium GW2011_GWE2_42_60]|nr:MAG: hypothetical protein UV38_C0002G0156 [candidate division TM6 bacterium GW2011_GWE2_42_60]